MSGQVLTDSEEKLLLDTLLLRQNLGVPLSRLKLRILQANAWENITYCHLSLLQAPIWCSGGFEYGVFLGKKIATGRK